MKLLDIWLSKDAWQRLIQLGKPPRMAYRLMTYERSVMNELDMCERERVRIVRELSGSDGQQAVSLQQGTPEFDRFLAEFGRFLDTESDLKRIEGVSMDDLIGALDTGASNRISEADLAALTPFFKDRDTS